MPITVRRGIPGNQFISFALMVFCVMKFRYICYHIAWDYIKFDLLNLNLEIWAETRNCNFVWNYYTINGTTYKYLESV